MENLYVRDGEWRFGRRLSAAKMAALQMTAKCHTRGNGVSRSGACELRGKRQPPRRQDDGAIRIRAIGSTPIQHQSNTDPTLTQRRRQHQMPLED
jgi:hypothetical protein